jgi:hypothetical protein
MRITSALNMTGQLDLVKILPGGSGQAGSS